MLKVFISYSSVDAELASRVEIVLKQLGVPYFRDVKDIGWGARLKESVDSGIAGCTHLIVILSPASLKSHWVPYEIGNANALGVQILPFLQHPSLEPPDYLRPFLNERSIEGIKGYFEREAEAAPAPRSRLEIDLAALTIELGFVTLEPLHRGIFTARGDAQGYKELEMAVAIGGPLTAPEGHFVIRPVRAGGFRPEVYTSFGDVLIRVGSPEPHGVVRAAVRLPIGAEHASVTTTLVPEQGWQGGATKQFYATCGPPSNPTGFRSGPLTIKRMR